jgi:hypothetical protein
VRGSPDKHPTALIKSTGGSGTATTAGSGSMLPLLGAAAAAAAYPWGGQCKEGVPENSGNHLARATHRMIPRVIASVL